MELTCSSTRPFSLLQAMYGDQEMTEIFSFEATVAGWLRTEANLAVAQSRVGRISTADAEAISTACAVSEIDFEQLLSDGRTVGYPILSLVRQVARLLPEGPNGRVHVGATTQDIMDTGLALQMRSASVLLQTRVIALGDALADLCELHATTILAARTHGQQAVPTTFGAKLAVFLDQAANKLVSAQQIVETVGIVSLHGAGGTSAALTDSAAATREELARLLGLESSDVPWHVNRDCVVSFGQLCDDIAGLTVRLAREVIDLSRTELSEVREPGGHHAGASSTMPQKNNPVLSEATLGLGVAASALVPVLRRSAEAGHERSAGEWQAEWNTVPEIAVLASSAISTITQVFEGLHIYPERMAENLTSDHSLLMAEAYMIRIADALGRERAHDIVYSAANEARRGNSELSDVLTRDPALVGIDLSKIEPAAYLGDCEKIVSSSVERWRSTRKAVL
jgi:3-carboxy-cis,cis-muconate cycloisomerase